MDTQSDYVVVGTGSAGAVVASRLSTDPATTVVALEAGPRDKNRFIGVPAAFSKLFRSEIDWDYLTEPQPELDGREIYWPRGKVLGGSSSMNAMMWVRGFASDYDEWAARAGPRWSYADVLGYFRRIENVTAAWHFVSGDDSGVTGPLHISRQRSPRSVTAAWLAAARECGFAAARPNSPRPEGFCETVVTQRRGARFSTADAYLKPAMRRKNLRVLTGATATRVVIDGDRAVGVEYQSDGQTRIVYARREVVLCAGAVNSPQLLMLSGIGDRGPPRRTRHRHRLPRARGRVQPARSSRHGAGFRRRKGQLVCRREARPVDQLLTATPRHAHLQRRRGVRICPAADPN